MATITIRIFAQPIVGPDRRDAQRGPRRPAQRDRRDRRDQQHRLRGHGRRPAAAPDPGRSTSSRSRRRRSARPTRWRATPRSTYIITVGNDGTDPVVGVKVRDFLPAGSRYIEATGTTASFLCTAAGRLRRLQRRQDRGRRGRRPSPSRPSRRTPPARTPTRRIADPDNTIPEGNEFDNQASVDTIVVERRQRAVPRAVHRQDAGRCPANPVARNAVVTYNIVVHNNGIRPA